MTEPDTETARFIHQLTASCASGSFSNFDIDLLELGKIVTMTSGADGDAARKKLVADTRVWEECYEFFENSGTINEAHRESEQFTRIFRGVLLVLRNLVVELPIDSGALFENLLATAANYRFPHNIVTSNFYLPTVSAFVELLVNSCRTKILHPSKVVCLLELFLETHWPALCSLRHPSMTLLQRVIVDGSNTLDETNHNDLIYDMFNDGSHVMNYLVDSISTLKIDISENHFGQEQAYLSILEQILSHESFEKYLLNQTQHQEVAWLKIAQIVIPNKLDWNNFQLTAMLSWSLECLKVCAYGIHGAFNDGVTADFESMVICTLDILSELAKFEQGIKFLNHYNVLDLLVKLFGALQMQVKPVTIKNKTQAVSGPGSFPHAKSMIVEILSCICHGNFTQQEQMREEHGLELVLSNCIIDDNNPFLRERCIVCIKLLLAENPGNQKFVAELEAKGAADDKVLHQAGYEVEVVDGKVKVKKRAESEDQV